MHDTKQVYYNEVKGKVIEINDSEDFPSVVLSVGHEVRRDVNICFKPDLMQSFKETYKLNDVVRVRFFVSSRKKHGRWYTMVNALKIISE